MRTRSLSSPGVCCAPPPVTAGTLCKRGIGFTQCRRRIAARSLDQARRHALLILEQRFQQMLQA
jgi:hypothetical protein